MARTILQEVGKCTAGPLAAVPLARWTLLVAVAVGGSLFYGGSLALVLPGWTLGGAALWLTLSAGLAWCVFIPALCLATRRPLGRCLDACLITMAGGEVVLAAGALANGLIWIQRVAVDGALLNASIVAISNVVMAALLATLLRREGVRVQTTIALWMVALNGSGAVFFLLFRPWLGAP